MNFKGRIAIKIEDFFNLLIFFKMFENIFSFLIFHNY